MNPTPPASVSRHDMSANANGLSSGTGRRPKLRSTERTASTDAAPSRRNAPDGASAARSPKSANEANSGVRLHVRRCMTKAIAATSAISTCNAFGENQRNAPPDRFGAAEQHDARHKHGPHYHPPPRCMGIAPEQRSGEHYFHEKRRKDGENSERDVSGDAKNRLRRGDSVGAAERTGHVLPEQPVRSRRRPEARSRGKIVKHVRRR